MTTENKIYCTNCGAVRQDRDGECLGCNALYDHDITVKDLVLKVLNRVNTIERVLAIRSGSPRVTGAGRIPTKDKHKESR